MKCSTFWKVLAAVAVVAAAGAAVYWFLSAKKRSCGCLCAAEDEPCECDPIYAEDAPCEVYSDGTAADDSVEG